MQPALRVYADDICATSRVCLDAQGSTRVGDPTVRPDQLPTFRPGEETP